MVKLSKKQKELMESLREANEGSEPGNALECSPDEYQTALALQRRGLIKVGGKGFLGHFEVKLEPYASHEAGTCPSDCQLCKEEAVDFAESELK